MCYCCKRSNNNKRAKERERDIGDCVRVCNMVLVECACMAGIADCCENVLFTNSFVNWVYKIRNGCPFHFDQIKMHKYKICLQQLIITIIQSHLSATMKNGIGFVFEFTFLAIHYATPWERERKRKKKFNIARRSELRIAGTTCPRHAGKNRSKKCSQILDVKIFFFGLAQEFQRFFVHTKIFYFCSYTFIFSLSQLWCNSRMLNNFFLQMFLSFSD